MHIFVDMNVVSLTINKAYVYDAVAETTAYTGLKMPEDPEAYNRIFTTDEDRSILEHFWAEAAGIATTQLKPFLISVNDQPVSHSVDLSNDYEVQLKLSSGFDLGLVDSIQTALFNFFVSHIVSKWYIFTDKPEAESYALDAQSKIKDAMSKIYHRMRPVRSTII